MSTLQIVFGRLFGGGPSPLQKAPRIAPGPTLAPKKKKRTTSTTAPHPLLDTGNAGKEGLKAKAEVQVYTTMVTRHKGCATSKKTVQDKFSVEPPAPTKTIDDSEATKVVPTLQSRMDACTAPWIYRDPEDANKVRPTHVSTAYETFVANWVEPGTRRFVIWRRRILNRIRPGHDCIFVRDPVRDPDLDFDFYSLNAWRIYLEEWFYPDLPLGPDPFSESWGSKFNTRFTSMSAMAVDAFSRPKTYDVPLPIPVPATKRSSRSSDDANSKVDPATDARSPPIDSGRGTRSVTKKTHGDEKKKNKKKKSQRQPATKGSGSSKPQSVPVNGPKTGVLSEPLYSESDRVSPPPSSH